MQVLEEAKRIRAIVNPFPGADRLAAAADSAFDVEDARWSQVAAAVDSRMSRHHDELDEAGGAGLPHIVPLVDPGSTALGFRA